MHFEESESTTVELKRDFPKNDQIIKTIIGFCNQKGGKLVIGVNGQRKIIGVDEEKIEKSLSSIDKAIHEASNPPIIPQVYVRRFGEKAILVIEVSSGMNKPYYRRKEGQKRGVYIRLGRNTIRATPEIIEELSWQSKNLDYELFPVYKATIDDLDEKKINIFLKNRKNKLTVSVSKKILEAYHLTTHEHSKTYPTIAGILLFGRDPQYFFSESMIICSHFKGNSGRDAIASIDCIGTLLDQFAQSYQFIIQRLHSSFKITGVKRTEKLEIPEIAIREALLNAIVHRNYNVKAPTKIAIFDDRIEIFSPGSFPGPLDPKNLTSGITYLRNPAICKVFRESGYIEKLGTGFITIFDLYEKNGLKTPEIIEGENFIKVILPREKGLQVKKTITDLINRQEEITISDVMDYLEVSRATATRLLNKSIEEKVVVRSGQTRSAKYIVNLKKRNKR